MTIARASAAFAAVLVLGALTLGPAGAQSPAPAQPGANPGAPPATPVGGVLACLLGLVLLQLLPLPAALAETISPHGERLRALYGVGGGTFTTISLVPLATAAGLAQLVIYVAGFAAVAGLVESEED